MEKDYKKILEDLKEQKKLVVGVEQKHDNEKYKLSNVWENEKINILHLLSFLYTKTILKGYNLTIRYNYNYNDLQTISIIQKYQNYDNTYTYTKYTFYNIPTNLAYLDTFKLEGILNNEKEQ